MIKNIVFDWSGTLSNDLEAVFHTNRDIFHDLGLAPLTFAHFQEVVDIPFRASLERLFAGNPEILAKFDDRKRWHGLFEKYFAVHGPPKPLPFAEAALEQLHGRFELAVLSAHHQHFLEAENRLFFPKRNYFSILFGSSGDKVKSFPRLIEQAGFRPAETIFVGDTTHDIIAGASAGVKTVAVLSGYHVKEKILSAGPDFVLGSVAELPALLSRNALSL